jgi:uncharacterized protein (DUF1015 family)
MVDIAPFRAIRFDARKVKALSDVIAPPYDVISPEQQDQLYAKSPHNIVRIDLNKSEPGDEPLSRYHRAAELLKNWLGLHVLAEDSTPALYVLAQTFRGPDGLERTRTGFFSKARLTAWGEGPIMPHERTLRGPKLDRLELFRATRANLSPIFGAFSDTGGELQKLFAQATRSTPVGEATMDGTLNRLWAVTAPEIVEPARKLMKPKKLYIADGHHRYETAIAYRDERRNDALQRGDTLPLDQTAYEHVLMFACPVEDPGMVIFPTHRLVHGLPRFDEPAMMRALSATFSIASLPKEAAADPARAQAALREAGAGKKNAYLLVTQSGPTLLVSKPEELAKVPSLPGHPALRGLDVSVLHAVVLEHVLGISREAQATQVNLRYSKDFAEAMSAPRRDPAVQAAFLMNATKIEEVIAVAESGEVMPQKSTFFYPKLPSGLVLYPLG